MVGEHRRALEAATADGEKFDTLAGHLYDPAHQSDQLCPDDIVEVVAKRYVLTDSGRLFYLREDGGVSERTASSGQYNLQVHGRRWQPRVSALLARVFPNTLQHSYDLSSYDLYDEKDDEWLGALRPKRQPAKSGIRHRKVPISHT